MSYCVNCGVELDTNLKKCPLCQTKVYNPQEREDIKSAETFPSEKGEVEQISPKETVIFTASVLISIIITCALLNGLVYNTLPWSVPVIGACITLGVFIIAGVYARKITLYAMFFFDALAVTVNMFMISKVTETTEWFPRVALPIIGVTLVLIELEYMLSRRFPFSLWTGALYFFIMIAVICLTIEIAVDQYTGGTIHLSWSAIVLTVCVVISAIIVVLLMMNKLRYKINRRLHF